MSKQANIRDIQILDALKASFGRFGEDVLLILASLQKQFEEIAEGLEEREDHWRRQVAAAQEEVYEARCSLSACENQGEDEEGNSPDCSFEEDQVSDAEKHLTECEDNLETVKQWRHRVEGLMAVFQNDIHRLSNLATSRTGSAQTFLAAKIEILNRYVGGAAGAVGITGLSAQGGNGKLVPSGGLPSTEAKKVRAQDLQRLLEEYQTAPPHKLSELRERAFVALEVQKSDRRQLAMTFLTDDTNTKNTARQGAEIIERFVHPKLVSNTKIAIYAIFGEEGRSHYTNGEVHLWTRAEKSTAAHEIMHAIEQQNPSVLLATAEFLLRRAGGEQPVKLSDLTGNSNYKPHEIAFKDKWKERRGRVYAGRVYSRSLTPTLPSQIRATEVLTKGIERLFDDPLEFYQADQDWFDFLIKTIRDL